MFQNERRARNAKYERERRAMLTDAYADLAVAAGYKDSVSYASIIIVVFTFWFIFIILIRVNCVLPVSDFERRSVSKCHCPTSARVKN